MKHLVCRAALALAVVSAAALAARAQDPRVEPPRTPAEWFGALEFELNTGQYGQALFYLRGFLAANPTDQDFAAIERDRGFAAFLRLRNIRWSTDPKADAEGRQLAEQVVERANAALRRVIGNPQQIAKYIRNLTASPEERAYAIRELQRAGALAMPQLIATLRQETDPYQRAAILGVLPVLPADTVAPLLAALDMPGNDLLKLQLIQALAARTDIGQVATRAETNPVPTLLYVEASPRFGPNVRKAAADLAARLLAIAPSRLPIAKVELTRAADRLYRHEVRFINPANVPVWRWEEAGLVSYAATASQAEEFFGLRYARWALDLDPAYEPAQVVFLSLATDKAMERGGLEAPLAQTAPDVHDLLMTVYAGALINTLDRALIENRTAVALGVTRALGERAEVLAARPVGCRTEQGYARADVCPPGVAPATQVTRMEGCRPGVLVRALDYPDRRVDLAAADALLRMPGPPVHQASARVVEVLRRAVAADAATGLPAAPLRVLVAAFDPTRLEQMAQAVRSAGFDVVAVRTGREVMRRLNEAADIDAVILDSEIPYTGLEDTLASLRYDVHAGLLPVRIVYQPVVPGTTTYLASGNRLVTVSLPASAVEANNLRTEARLNRLIESYRNVAVVRGPLLPDTVKRELTAPEGVAAEVAPPASVSPPLTPAERKAQSVLAIEWLSRLAACPHLGYDVRPAERTILQAINVPELAKPAIEAASRLPGRDPQIELARVVLNAAAPPDVRVLAAENLVRHAQRYGNALGNDMTKALIDLQRTLQDPTLRARVAAAVGAIYSPVLQSGERLQRYVPPLPKPAPPPTPAPAPIPPTEPATPPPPPPEQQTRQGSERGTEVAWRKGR